MGRKSRQKKSRTPEAGRDHPASMGHRGAFAAAVVVTLVVAAAVYANTLSNGFVYDDDAQVLENPWIRDAKFIPNIFTQSVWSFLEAKAFTSNYYRPLMHLIYMVNYHIFGLRPWGFHLVNISLHAAMSVLVLIVIRRLLNYPAQTASPPSGSTLLPAFAGALLFATHPIHTEAVTWIASVPEISYALFSLSSLYFYMKAREGGRWAYGYSLGSFAAASFCKEPALMLPFILISYDFAFRPAGQSGPRFDLKRYLPFFGISLVYVMLRTHALSGFSPGQSGLILRPLEYAINVFPLFAGHLGKLFLPANLSIFHVFHPISSLFEIPGVIGVLATIAFSSLVYWGAKKNGILFFSLVMIALPLLPALYIPALGEAALAERYLYLPSFGFVLLLAWAFSRLRPGWQMNLALVLLLALIAIYSVSTVGRNMLWRDDITLFEDTLKKSPDAVPPRLSLGYAYMKMGRIDEAIRELKTVLELRPDSITARANLGSAYIRKNRLDEGIRELKTALDLNPNISRARSDLGAAYAMQNRLDKAIPEFKAAIELNPDFAEGHNNLGLAYRNQKELPEAVAEFNRALHIDPDYADAHYNLGLAYAESSRLDEAIAEYRTALRLKPDYAAVHYNLGLAFAAKTRLEDAIAEYKAALALKPDFIEASKSLDECSKRLRSSE